MSQATPCPSKRSAGETFLAMLEHRHHRQELDGAQHGVEDAESDRRPFQRTFSAKAVRRHRNGSTLRCSVGQNRCCTKCCTFIPGNALQRRSTPRSPLQLSTTCAKLRHFVIDRSPVQFRSSAPEFLSLSPATRRGLVLLPCICSTLQQTRFCCMAMQYQWC